MLAALYILVMFQRTMTGPLREDNAGIRDLNPLEMASLAPAIVLMVGLGFFPQPMLNVINPAVDETLARIGVGDPPPQVAPVCRRPQTSPTRSREGPRMTPIQAPDVEYALIAPILIVSGGAVLGTLVEAFVSRKYRFVVQTVVAFATVLAALADPCTSTRTWTRWPASGVDRSPPRARSPSTGRGS